MSRNLKSHTLFGDYGTFTNNPTEKQRAKNTSYTTNTPAEETKADATLLNRASRSMSAATGAVLQALGATTESGSSKASYNTPKNG